VLPNALLNPVRCEDINHLFSPLRTNSERKSRPASRDAQTAESVLGVSPELLFAQEIVVCRDHVAKLLRS